jgi:DnaK suppressor protein
LTPEEKEEIRKEIEERIESAEKSLEQLKEQTAPVPPSVAIGRLTRMDAIQQKSVAEANLKTTEKQISDLKKTLKNIDDPDFGICASCGKTIPPGRILIVPESRVCVQCASGKRRG